MTDPAASASIQERVLDPGVAQARASDPAASVWVAASAGTGKTKVLTDRVLRLLLAGTRPERLLCLTFTKAAAAEMANRIHATLAKWATLPDEKLEDGLAALTGERPDAAARAAARRLFARVLDAPGGMKIQTIHAFCQSLLARFPLEAGLPQHFAVMDDLTAAELMADARHAAMAAARGDDGPLGRALALVAGTVGEGEFAQLVAGFAAERGRWQRIKDELGGLEGAVAEAYRHIGITPDETETKLRESACADAAFQAEALRAAARALLEGKTSDQPRGQGIADWLAADARARLDGLDGYANLFLTEGSVRKRLATKDVIAVLPNVVDVLTEEAERLQAVLERCRAARTAEATAALMRLGDAVLERYGAAKRRRALLDYDDLIVAARDLLHRPGVAPWVLFKLDGGLDHILVDEAQDTNPEQWHVVAALAEEFFSGRGAAEGRARTVFAVGDEKQSIFSFQRAEPAEFARMRDHFARRVQEAGERWERVPLTISFRSTDAVLRLVDAVFARSPARDGVVSDGETVEHRAFRRGHAGLVELWPPVAPDPKADVEPWSPPLARTSEVAPAVRLAGLIAGTVAGWVEREEVLESRGRPIHAGDVLILVRRRGTLVDMLVRALKARGVAVAGADRLLLTSHIGVMDLLVLAEFLLLPEDDLALATLLKSPLVGLSEERLFELAHGRPDTLWRSLVAAAERDPDLAPVRAWLGDLLSSTDFVAPHELFAGLLDRPCPADATSGRRAMSKRLGSEALDPLDEFLALTLAFERTHPPSLQGFLHWLEAGETEIKREQDQAGEPRLRIMTVHGSKGLQAPVVFLPDTIFDPRPVNRLLWPFPGEARRVPLWCPRASDREAAFGTAQGMAERRRDEEERRLLYVALTRAEDRLYVGGYQTQRRPHDLCWYNLVADALRAHPDAEPFAFAQSYPDQWDGEALRLSNPQTAEPKRDPARVIASAPPEPLPAWGRAAAPVETPPYRPLTPSRPEEPEPAVTSPLAAEDGSAFRRGRLIHRLLQTLPDLPSADRPGVARRYLASPVHGLSERAQELIAAEVLAVLDDPTLAPLFGPRSRAEAPVVGTVTGRDGSVHALSGQIDRLAVTDDAVWIVDYKTNRRPPLSPDEVPAVYLRQMAAYRAALRQIYPGLPVRCLLLWTDGPRVMSLPDTLLDRHGP